VSEMLIQNSGASPPQRMIEKTVRIDMSANTRVDHYTLEFCL